MDQLDLSLTPLFMQLDGLIDGAIASLPKIALAVLALLITWAIARLAVLAVKGALMRLKLRQALIDVSIMMLTLTIWITGGLIALIIVFPSITPARALTTLGLGSVAIGFAFKDIFENFLAGVLLLIREPFKTGDYVESAGIEGQVERITVRDSHVRQTDGQLVVIPNAQLFKNPVVVRTDRAFRRAEVICGIAYAEDATEAREVIEQAVIAVDSVRDDVRDVQVFAKAFGASSIDFQITWWTGSRPVDIRQSRDEVVRAVKAALDDAGIEIPFPYRTLTLEEKSLNQIAKKFSAVRET